MKEYLDLGKRILEANNSVADRTGDGCISLFGEQLKFDLSKGLPLVTTKKLAYKTVISELLWFISGSTDRRHLQEIQHGEFTEDRFDIWKGNAKSVWHSLEFNYYTIGNMYGRQWRKKETPTMQLDYIPHKSTISKDIVDFIDVVDVIKDSLDWQLYLKAKNHYIKNGSNMHSLEDHDFLYVTWGMMIEDIEERSKAMFHPIGICVDWLTVEKFSEDIQNIPYFNAYYKQPDMFKFTSMYFGTDAYDINTTIFMYKDVYDRYELDMIFAINGCTDVLLPRLVTDQFDTLLEELDDVIYSDDKSASRRLVIDAWNPNYKDDSVLAICHPFVQFNYTNGKLNCSFYQRSADYFLGLPFNIASYAILTQIIADYMKVEVGTLTCSLGDVHIYNSHIDQVKEQITRDVRELPTLVIKDFLNIENLKLDDFEILNYNPHDVIKAEMKV